MTCLLDLVLIFKLWHVCLIEFFGLLSFFLPSFDSQDRTSLHFRFSCYDMSTQSSFSFLDCCDFAGSGFDSQIMTCLFDWVFGLFSSSLLSFDSQVKTCLQLRFSCYNMSTQSRVFWIVMIFLPSFDSQIITCLLDLVI